jgi:hypothetical protein
MANIVYNGDFQNPTLNSGDFIDYPSMSSQQLSDFYWIGTSNTLLNRDTTGMGYPQPPTGVSSQYVCFQYNSSLYQTVNILKKGKYALTLFVCRHPSYTVLGLDILFDNVLITTIPSTIASSWNLFRIEFNITRTGNQILQFLQQIDTANFLAITNVSLIGIDFLDTVGTMYLPPLNFSKTKLFNIEDYDYQDKSITLRTGDERYLKNNVDINHFGDFYVDGNFTSRMFLNRPSNYYTNVKSNIQSQIDNMITQNLGGGYWSIIAEGSVSTSTNSGYNFAFGASLTTTNLYTFICADCNLIGIGISHATSVATAIIIGMFLQSNAYSSYNITIPTTASAGRQFQLDLTSQNITFVRGNYFRLRTMSGAGGGATRLTFFFKAKV